MIQFIADYIRRMLEYVAPSKEVQLWKAFATEWRLLADHTLEAMETAVQESQKKYRRLKASHDALEAINKDLISKNIQDDIELKMIDSTQDRYVIQMSLNPKLSVYLMNRTADPKRRDVFIRQFSQSVASTVEHRTRKLLAEKSREEVFQPRDKRMLS